MNPVDRRFAQVLVRGIEFTADDVTMDGTVTAAGNHDPNRTQNAIGSIFNQHSRQGHINFTGRVVRSHAPHRKGGAIRVWEPTAAGIRWAKQALS